MHPLLIPNPLKINSDDRNTSPSTSSAGCLHNSSSLPWVGLLLLLKDDARSLVICEVPLTVTYEVMTMAVSVSNALSALSIFPARAETL